MTTVASVGEATLALHLRAYGVVAPALQFSFAAHLSRAYRFDFCWPDRMFAVEVDGAVHRIKGRFRADIERHNLAQALGWTVFRFSPADVQAGRAIDAIRAWLAGDAQGALTALQEKSYRSPAKRGRRSGCSSTKRPQTRS